MWHFEWHIERRAREIGCGRSCQVKALAEWTKTGIKKEHGMSRELQFPLNSDCHLYVYINWSRHPANYSISQFRSLLASALREPSGTATLSYCYTSILLLINGIKCLPHSLTISSDLVLCFILFEVETCFTSRESIQFHFPISL